MPRPPTPPRVEGKEWNAFLHESQHVFDLLAGLTGNTSVLEKEEILLAYCGGDHASSAEVTEASAVFQGMDTSQDGVVSRPEWRDWLQREFDLRGETGPAWLGSFLHRIRGGIRASQERTEEKKQVAAAKAVDADEELWKAAVSKPHQVAHITEKELAPEALIPDEHLTQAVSSIHHSEAAIIAYVKEVQHLSELDSTCKVSEVTCMLALQL